MKQLTMNDRQLIGTALLNYIKLLKEQLIHIGISEGLSSEKTLSVSEELDKYIYLYQSFQKTSRELVI